MVIYLIISLIKIILWKCLLVTYCSRSHEAVRCRMRVCTRITEGEFKSNLLGSSILCTGKDSVQSTILAQYDHCIDKHPVYKYACILYTYLYPICKYVFLYLYILYTSLHPMHHCMFVSNTQICIPYIGKLWRRESLTNLTNLGNRQTKTTQIEALSK